MVKNIVDYKAHGGRTLSIAIRITMLALLLAGGAGATTITVPDDYARIQWAIDNATAGDTIEVHGGTYYENVNVNKRLTLIGESNSTTIINGSGNVVQVTANGGAIYGFRIQNGSNGIYITSSNNVISNNVIKDMIGENGGGASSGIFLSGSTSNTITDNTISNMTGGAGREDIYGSCDTGGNSSGIYFSGSTNNTLSGNTISNIIGGTGAPGGEDYGPGPEQVGFGIYLETDSYQNVIDITNTVDGDPIVFLYDIDGAVIEDHILTANSNPTNLGKIVLINSRNIIIRNNIIRNMTGGAGVRGEYWGSGGSGDNSFGIYILGSTNNTLTGNTISNIIGGAGGEVIFGSGGSGGNSSGIYLLGSTNITLISNTISNIIGGAGGQVNYEGSGGSGGNSAGIYLSSTLNNTLIGNIISNIIGGAGAGGGMNGDGGNGGISSGIYFSGSTINTLTDNTISNLLGGSGGFPGYEGLSHYCGGGSGGSSYGIYLSGSTNNTLIGNTIINVTGGAGNMNGLGGISSGIYLSDSSNNTLIGNTFNNIEGGAGGEGSPYSAGYAGGNSFGIYLSGSTYNTFITSNIINNIIGGMGGEGGSTDSGRPGGSGGTSLGIYISGSVKNKLTGNTISNIVGGMGGGGAWGWFYSDSGGSGGISSGIYVSSSTNNTITGSAISNMTGGTGGTGGSSYDGISGSGGSGGISSGIYFSGSTNNILTGNTISKITGGIGGTGGSGASNGTIQIGYSIYLETSTSSNNKVYNNIFNNNNTVLISGSINKWNNTKQSGTNIIGGSYLSGNVWANPQGLGFSQTCPDSNKDGICDLPYTLDSNNTDYFPLAYPPASITSWGNSKTNKNLTLTANKGDVIRFNATANQPVTTWRWYKDNVYQSNNYNNFSTSWNSEGSFTIKVNATNAYGASNTITWHVAINPPKIGKSGSPWTGFSAMEHTTEEKGKPGTVMIGLFRDSFSDNDQDWTVSYGNISVVNGKLKAYGDINARLSRNIGNHTKVAIFVSMNETNLDGIKDFSVRADTSRNELAKTYYLSVRPDGKQIRIVTKNITSWIDINISNWQRKTKETNYCIFTAFNTIFKGYCSNRSYAHALSIPAVTSGTNSLYSYGNTIGLGAAFNTTRGTDTTTFDDVAVLELDSIGNIRTTGNLTTSYDAGTGKLVHQFRVNATTPANTNYSAWYRQTNTGAYTQAGRVYTGSNTVTISGTKYRNTQVQLRLRGNKTASPEIESIEYFSQNAAQPISITSPNGGETWVRGTIKKITWNYTGSPGAYVKIELMKNGVFNRTITSNTSLSRKYYNWTIISTQIPGTNYKVKITSLTNPSYNDISDNNFNINAPLTSITVLSPNGGESWQRGTTKTITWTSSDSPGSNVKIELLKGGVLNRTINSSTPNDGSHSWTIPTTQATGSTYKVRVTSTTNVAYTDSSNANFTISSSTPSITVVSPNGGESWIRGSKQIVRWSYSGSAGKYVKIDLMKGGVFNRSIISNVSIGTVSGSYNWTISSTQTLGTNYKVKITSLTNPAYTDTSNNNFTIRI